MLRQISMLAIAASLMGQGVDIQINKPGDLADATFYSITIPPKAMGSKSVITISDEIKKSVRVYVLIEKRPGKERDLLYGFAGMTDKTIHLKHADVAILKKIDKFWIKDGMKITKPPAFSICPLNVETLLWDQYKSQWSVGESEDDLKSLSKTSEIMHWVYSVDSCILGSLK